jgi:hypothetical protein
MMCDLPLSNVPGAVFPNTFMSNLRVAGLKGIFLHERFRAVDNQSRPTNA